MRLKLFSLAISSILLLASCVWDDPEENSIDANTDAGADTDGNAECSAADMAYEEDIFECDPAWTDYRPRTNSSQDDTWEVCISDDGQYHQIEESVSSIARVEAYDDIGGLLWENSAVTAQDFIDARILFEEDQGIGSRVARRYDVHYDPPPDGACEDDGVPAAYPDYCVGPAVLQPIIVEAFADGCLGKNLSANAAKIEAALQWFLYVSAVKEATTCATTPKDCDSCWAYYSGGTPRDTPAGLAADIDDWAPETHDRAYDGVLAVRCWRDLDSEENAQNLEMQTQAIEQLDSALLRGMAVLVRQRFHSLSCSTGTHQQAALEWLRIVIPLFDRETRTRDPEVANLLKKEVAKAADKIDLDSVIATIDFTYPCP